MNLFVMLKTVIISFLTGPATLMYPERQRKYTTITRGMINIDINQCIFCGLCGKKCPTDSIIVSKENREWTIDRLRCITCGACVEVCPKKCLAMGNHYSPCTTDRVGALYTAKAGSLPEKTDQA